MTYIGGTYLIAIKYVPDLNNFNNRSQDVSLIPNVTWLDITSYLIDTRIYFAKSHSVLINSERIIIILFLGRTRLLLPSNR